MARCPNCEAALDVRATACAECRAVFGGDSVWEPVAETSAEQAALSQLYPAALERGKQAARDQTSMKWAALVFAILGNLTHIALSVGSTHRGLETFPDELARRYTNTACLSCTLSFDLGLFVGWFGGPFYLLLLAALVSKAPGGVAMLIVLLAGLDVLMFFATNSKDWYVVLSPVLLGGLAFLVLLVVVINAFVSAGKRRH